MIFHASAMGRVVKCPGSKKIQQAYPRPEGDDPKEGGVAHSIAASVIKGTPIESFLGKSIDNIYIDQEFLNHVETYTSECVGDGVVETGAGVEYQGHELTGTPDFWRYDGATRTLYIKDLKFGFGWVEVFENYQLLAYALMLTSPEVAHISMTIVQPRANHPKGPVREWCIDVEDLRSYGNFIYGAMGDAALAEPPVHTGAHCRYCSGLLNCHAARAAAGYALDYSGASSHAALSPGQLTLELELVERAVNMLKQRQTALEEEAFNCNKRGVVIPGWTVTVPPSALAWTVDDPISIGDAMKVDLRGPLKPITPTQAISRKLLPKATVEALAARGTGSPKLTRVDHAKAKRILGGE